MTMLIVLFGKEFLNIIPGRVSTEVDARLSYDKHGTVQKALEIVSLYREMGIEKDRVLIKIAATWEGIEACHILEKEYGIHCNLTLIFSKCQAVACGIAGATLISPFVGRITDWDRNYNREASKTEDRGVSVVKEIYHYMKKFHPNTSIMAASFRSTDQIISLCGIDLITISPKLLEELESLPADIMVPRMHKKDYDFEAFQYQGNPDLFNSHLQADRMACELLKTGIEKFINDTELLTELLKEFSANN